MIWYDQSHERELEVFWGGGQKESVTSVSFKVMELHVFSKYCKYMFYHVIILLNLQKKRRTQERFFKKPFQLLYASFIQTFLFVIFIKRSQLVSCSLAGGRT